ncbi:MAG: HAMP domain-containing protein [Leptolyngbya sp. SIOISBB]|nr:HAMP domain-containing protein [Leptolyngbya sp. SIOISBB]
MPKTWLRRLLDETRTRILLLYAATLLSAIAVSIPLFRYFLFSEIDARVRSDLRAERAAFQAAYDDWEAQSPSDQPALTRFIDDYFASKIPEDDNFHIVLLDGDIYRSNPRALPEILQIDSDLMQAILTYDTAVEDSVATNAPEIGRILYKTTLIRDADASRGTFVAVHLSAGEQSEALVGVWVFFKVASGVVVIAFVLAWLGSRQLLKPVQQLSTAAKEINEKTLSQRLEVQGSGELAELAKTFNAMMDRVQHAFETQQRFINDASHELRTPLTIIQGHLEIMDDDPEEQAETIALVMDELERMGRFVSDLLLLAKSERPDFLQLEMIDVPTFMEALFAKVGTLAERTWQLQNLEQGTLVADRLRLTGALINLAQNAAQHTQPDALIEIGVERLNQKLRFWVRDTGSGISAADQAHIFDRFARASHTRRRSEGAGLGLAIVKAIAEAHGGHVELTSQLGVGSTFSVILPFEPLLEKPA